MNACPIYRIAGLFTVGVLSLNFAVPCRAAIESRNVLKTYFETGDVPTEDQFANLIDSTLNLVLNYGSDIESHAADLDAVGGIAGDSSGNAERFEAGDTIDSFIHRIDDGVYVGSSSDWPGKHGFLGLQFELPDVSGSGLGPTTHYGFVEMSVDGPASSTPYAIHVYGFAYEGDPDRPIIISHIVPEPAGFVLLAMGLIGLGMWQNTTRPPMETGR